MTEQEFQDWLKRLAATLALKADELVQMAQAKHAFLRHGITLAEAEGVLILVQERGLTHYRDKRIPELVSFAKQVRQKMAQPVQSYCPESPPMYAGFCGKPRYWVQAWWAKRGVDADAYEAESHRLKRLYEAGEISQKQWTAHLDHWVKQQSGRKVLPAEEVAQEKMVSPEPAWEEME